MRYALALLLAGMIGCGAVAMGQAGTTPTVAEQLRCLTDPPDALRMKCVLAHVGPSAGNDQIVMWGEEESLCERHVTFRGVTKSVKDLFPSECGVRQDTCIVGTREMPCEDAWKVHIQPNGPAEAPPNSVPPGCTQNKNGVLNCGSSGELTWTPGVTFDWQAIADHCHVEELVHHWSAADFYTLHGPGFDTPVPEKSVPDTWELESGMRIVCK